MYGRLLLTVGFCLFFTTVLSLQCYLGTDNQCMIGPDMDDCGDGAECYCVKYRFACTLNDGACTASEQQNHVTKWAYTVVSDETCKAIKANPNIYQNAKCCSKDKCNRPDSGKCVFSSFSRRLVQRKIY